ncbi:MAG: hypothetical protein SGPRY_005830 [Prymnesium sp.]
MEDSIWPVGDPRANPRPPSGSGWFTGLLSDISLRYPSYREDWSSGLRGKTLGATLFLYFACLAPVVAFGGALQVATQGQLGIVETIVSRGACGMAYASLAGQPMTFIGPTGLTLTFTTALYAFTSPRAIPFLPMYAWVGLWTSLFLLLAAALDLSTSIRYCPRFTDEVFTAFLAPTHLFTASSALALHLSSAARAQALHLPSGPSSSSSALLALLLGLTTWRLCEASSSLATSRYGSPALRSLVADFGPAAAVGLVSALSMLPFARLLAEVPRLALPLANKLNRPLLVPLLSLPTPYRLLAAIPALFLAMLFFLDQNITVRTVNSPANKLCPRPTYHLDLAVLALLTGATSLAGLPWMCAATVESINHIRSMTDYAERRGGDSSPPNVRVVEPRFREQFDEADVDNNGYLSAEEVVAILRQPDEKGKRMTPEKAAKQAGRRCPPPSSPLQLATLSLPLPLKLLLDEFTAWRASTYSSESTDSSVLTPPTPETVDERVVETRLSGFLVHAMVLSTLSFVSRLRVVPVAVVHGVFFYLGKKFLERLRALAVPLPTNLDTDSESERSILVLGRPSVAMFTGLQLACLATLWALKLTPGLGMIFPAAIGVLMCIRAQLLPRLFTRRLLATIDTPIWSIRRRTSLYLWRVITGIQLQLHFRIYE